MFHFQYVEVVDIHLEDFSYLYQMTEHLLREPFLIVFVSNIDWTCQKYVAINKAIGPFNWINLKIQKNQPKQQSAQVGVSEFYVHNTSVFFHYRIMIKGLWN